MIVYKITNELNSHSYVGFTSQPMMKRFRCHLGTARRGAKWPLHNAIRKYGKENFSVKTIYEGSDAFEQEDKYIKKYGYYNIMPGGIKTPVAIGSTRTFTQEWKENMSKSAIERAKRLNTSEKMSGEGNHMYGKLGIGAKERIYKGKVYKSLIEMCKDLNITRPTARRWWREEGRIQLSLY